jgi:hypothetical protein
MSKLSKNYRQTLVESDIVAEKLFSMEEVGFTGKHTPECLEIWKSGWHEGAFDNFIDMLSSKDLDERLYGLAGLKLYHSTWYTSQDGLTAKESLASSAGTVQYGELEKQNVSLGAREAVEKLDAAEFSVPKLLEECGLLKGE